MALRAIIRKVCNQILDTSAWGGGGAKKKVPANGSKGQRHQEKFDL